MFDPNAIETENRITKVETLLERTLLAVDTLTTTVNHYITTNNKTNWGVLFAGMTILVMLVFGFDTLVRTPMDERIDHNLHLIERLEEFHYESTHGDPSQTPPELFSMDAASLRF